LEGQTLDDLEKRLVDIFSLAITPAELRTAGVGYTAWAWRLGQGDNPIISLPFGFAQTCGLQRCRRDIALSTKESEYSALSEATWEVLWLMGLMTEVKERMAPMTINIPTIKCTMLEDNKGAKAMATTPKMTAY
jgi:hypothetical protein